MDLLEDISSEESCDTPDSQGSSQESEGYESEDFGDEDTEESVTDSLKPDSGFRTRPALDIETEASPVTRVTKQDCYPGFPFLSFHDAYTLRATSKVHAKVLLDARLSSF